MAFDNWAVIWSDRDEIEKITNATASQLVKLKERILAGELKLTLPSLEYTLGRTDSNLPLDFEREATLINSLDPLNEQRFMEEVKAREPFRPFVAMLEGTFLAIYWLPDYYRCRWSYLKNSHLVGEESLRKIESLLRLADWEIQDHFKKGKLAEKETIETFDMDLIREAEKKNPEANQLVYKHVIKKKPVNTVAYNGNNYLAITFGKPGQPPTILFPEASRESIPDAPGFYGRVCGIVNFIANPPPLMSGLVLQAVILALPVRY